MIKFLKKNLFYSWILLTIIYIVFIAVNFSFAAPSQSISRTIIPETDSTYDLGGSGNDWNRLYVDELCLSAGICYATITPGLHVDGGGFVYPQTGDYHSAPYYTASSTSATSTFSGGVNIGSGGLVYDYSSGNVGIGTSTPTDTLSLGKNDRIYLNTDIPTATAEGLIKLQYLDDEAKAIIEFIDENNTAVIWLQAHHKLSGSADGHKHFSIEASDTGGLKQTRFSVPYDCDYNCAVTFNQSDVVITRNSGQTNGNLAVGGKWQDNNNFDFYPNYATNASVAFRVATTTGNDIILSALSSTRMEIGEPNLYLNGGAGTNSTIRIAAPDQFDQILEFYRSDATPTSLGNITYDESAVDLKVTNSITGSNSDIIFSTGTTGEVARFKGSGNVGIGTISPNLQLQIQQTTGGELLVSRDDSSIVVNDLLGGIGFDGNDGNVPVDVTHASVGIYGYAAESQGTSDKGGYMTFNTHLINDDDDTANTERMRITDAGFIGIGTTSPSTILEVNGETTFTPSPTTSNIVAGTGIINIANTIMKIQGSGGAVDITANPQIEAGEHGQMLILEGQSDTNTVQLDNGNGLHIHGKAILASEDTITLFYDADDSEWHELSRNFTASDKSWSFASPSGASGTFYSGGFYEFGSTDNDFNPTINVGTANESHAAHFLLVQAAGGAGGTDTVVRITGTSIADDGTRTTSDTEDLTIDDAGSAGDYYETTKKWIGQVAVVKQSGPDLLMNYGLVKYWDNNNTDFRLLGLDVTGRAGANDSAPNISLIHHKVTGWTYNNGAEPTRPTAIANMDTDHSTESEYVNGHYFAWKRDNLTTAVSGGNSEGIIIEWVTTANKAIDLANFVLRIRPN